MLDFLRRKSQSKVIQVTIIIIIAVFVFWGVGSNQGSGRNAVATVNDEPILYQDYQKQYEQMTNNLRSQFGGSIPKGFLEAANFKHQVLDQLIQSSLMRQGAQEMGLYVSDSELRDTIQNMEVFKKNGVFDVKWYEEVLTSSRMTVSTFEEGMRHDLLYAKIIDQLSRFSQISQSELMELFRYNNNKIDLQYAEFNPENFKDKVSVTDENLTEYFNQNKDSYKSEAQVKLKYINLSKSSQMEEAKISDEEINTYYQNNIKRYSRPEQRQASHILLKLPQSAPEEQVAEKKKALSEIIAKVNKGEDFGELAKQHSEDPGSAASGGDLGYFSKGRMVKAFEEATFSMKEGDISDIIQTQFGLHIIKLTGIKSARIAPLEEVKESVIRTLQSEKTKSIAFEKAEKIYKGIISAGSLDKYAANLNNIEPEAKEKTQIVETDFFSQNNPSEELRALPSLISTAFTLKKGELSSILDTGRGYAILFVQDRKEPAMQELAEVKEKVSEDFKEEEAARLAKEEAESLLKSLKEGADLQEEAAKLKITLKTTGFVSRKDLSSSSLPQHILQENFDLSEKKKYPDEVAKSGRLSYVVSFNASQETDQSSFETEKEILTNQLKGRKADTLLAAWVDYLREESEIRINEEML